nr:flagellar assembly protein FliH [Bacillus dakarensis]
MSRLIKYGWNIGEQKNKVISIKQFKENHQEDELPVEPDQSHFLLEERKHILDQAKEEAEVILNQAKSQADAMKAEISHEKANWEKQAAALSNKAKQMGFDEGFQEGQQRGYEEVRELIGEAVQIVENSKLDYQKKIQSSELTILDLGLKVAEKIIGEQLASNPDHFLAIVRNALKEARDYREIQLHVNPYYYGFLISQKEDLLKIFPKETELYIYPDPDLPEQSCIIESASGRIDASVDQQLEEIKRKLFEMLESE